MQLTLRIAKCAFASLVVEQELTHPGSETFLYVRWSTLLPHEFRRGRIGSIIYTYSIYHALLFCEKCYTLLMRTLNYLSLLQFIARIARMPSVITLTY